MVGTVEPRKGHRQALAAVRALQTAGTDLRLVVVGVPGWGPSALHDELERAAATCRTSSGAVTSTTPTCDRLYGSADLCWPLPRARASGSPSWRPSTGLPVLARRLPAFREVLAGSAQRGRSAASRHGSGPARDWPCARPSRQRGTGGRTRRPIMAPGGGGRRCRPVRGRDP